MGRVCRKCGSEDLTPSGKCRPCHAAYMRAWNASPAGVAYAAKIKDEKAAKAKIRYEQNIDERRREMREKANTPEGRKHAAARQVTFRQNSPEKHKVIWDRYRATEKGVLRRRLDVV